MKIAKISFQKTTKILPEICILIFVLLLKTIGFSQTIENGWKGIKPLETNKDTVDKLLGKPEIDDNRYQNYSNDDAFIQVNYSTAPCENNQYKRGKYKVKQDTVLDYIVYLKKMIKLSDFAFNRKDYTKDTSGDVLSSADYRNTDNSVSIGVYIQEGTEYVTRIYFRPNKQNAQTFKCKEE